MEGHTCFGNFASIDFAFEMNSIDDSSSPKMNAFNDNRNNQNATASYLQNFLLRKSTAESPRREDL